MSGKVIHGAKVVRGSNGDYKIALGRGQTLDLHDRGQPAGALGARRTRTAWAAKVAAVLANVSDAFIDIYSDSTWVGGGAGTGSGLLTGARAKSPAASLAKLFVARGVPAADDAFFGERYVTTVAGASVTGYDPRVVLSGADYVADGNLASFGGLPVRLNAAGETYTITPTEVCNEVDIYFRDDTGSFDVTHDGGASLGVVTLGNTLALRKVTKAFTRGAGPIQITFGSGVVYIVGVVPRDTTVRKVHIRNMAAYGTTVNLLTTSHNNYWKVATNLDVVTPDLAVLDLSINSAGTDTASLVNLPTWAANNRTMIEGLLDVDADVRLMTSNPTGSGAGLDGRLAAYAAKSRELAEEYGLELIDLYGEWESFAAKNPLGLYADNIHPSAPGYCMKAQSAFESIYPF